MIDDIYYTSIDGLTDELLTSEKKIKIVDEGYWGGTNLESNLPKVIELGSAMNAIRNRGHTVIFLYSKLNRATKMLLESANYWFHKPSPDHALLYIRDKEFVGNDPWVIEDLLKAKKKREKRKLMLSNPNFIETFEVPRIRDSIFDAYEKEKLKQQEEYQQKKMRARESTERRGKIVEWLKGEYASPTPPFTMETLREYLMGKGFSRSKAKVYALAFKDELLENQLVTTITEKEEAAE